MKTPRERFKAAIRKFRVSRADIAARVGLSPRSLENLLSGAQSQSARQRVTDELAAFAAEFEPGFPKIEIWPGIRPMKRPLTFPEGAEIETPVPDEEWMNRTLSEYAGFVERIGEKILRFTKPTPVFVERCYRGISITLQPPRKAADDSLADKFSAASRDTRTTKSVKSKPASQTARRR